MCPRAPAPTAASPRRPPPTSLLQPRGAEPTPPSPPRSGVGAALTARVGTLEGTTPLADAGVRVCSACSEPPAAVQTCAAGRGRVLTCRLGSAVPRCAAHRHWVQGADHLAPAAWWGWRQEACSALRRPLSLPPQRSSTVPTWGSAPPSVAQTCRYSHRAGNTPPCIPGLSSGDTQSGV